jgi:endoglucanase
VPKGGELKVEKDSQTITQALSYPDPGKNRTGFNPIEYPDLELSYSVSVQALEGNSLKVSVDLDKALPKEWVGKVGFNFELFPSHLLAKAG